MTIKVDGATQRSFIFPAPVADALVYYSNVARIVQSLPHIYTIKTFDSCAYRMLYSTTELGLYHISIYCDIQSNIDYEGRVLRFLPILVPDPVEPSAGMNSSVANGLYTSESVFIDEGERTRIDYRLSICASLPVPLAALWMPASVRDRISSSITQWRIHEIADGFIRRTIGDYENHGS